MQEVKITMLISILLFGTSCAYDNAEELYGEQTCPPGGMSFSQTIHPIINSNCAIIGCHVSGQQLPTLENYAQISSDTAKIKARTSTGTMPPSNTSKSISPEEIDAIACWVDVGAPEN